MIFSLSFFSSLNSRFGGECHFLFLLENGLVAKSLVL